MRKFLILAVALVLSACASPDQIKDYSDRAVVYGWVDVGDVAGNKMVLAQIRQYSPRTDAPYWGIGYEKFGNGYLFWHYGVATGARYEIDKFQLMSCAGGIVCTNTINEYVFGKFGDGPGQVAVTRPAVYYMGSFALDTTKRPGLFRSGTFDIKRTSGPSRQAMLNYLLDHTPAGHPELKARIRGAMK